MKFKKKLIEVAVPLDSINAESLKRKTKAPKGWSTTFHKWWAQRPIAAARAVIFAQMVDDPSSHPDIFPTDKLQEKERARLFKIIDELVKWDNSNNKQVLQSAQDEIWKSWRFACAENANAKDAKILYDRFRLPSFWDPFSGGGSLPLSAQWLGLESYATDLNPVAVLINKGLVEIPSLFINHKPVRPNGDSQNDFLEKEWSQARGLAEDVRFYGEQLKVAADKLIKDNYPEIDVTKAIVDSRPDLAHLLGEKITPVAYIWARTVKSPNPAFTNVWVPLATTFMLSDKPGRETYIEPEVKSTTYELVVKVGKPQNIEQIKSGTKLSRGANFKCLMSGLPITSEHIKSEGKAGRMGARLMAIVAESKSGRVYLSPTSEQEKLALILEPDWKPEVIISGSTQYLGVKPYGIDRFDQLFTNRQLVAMDALCNLVGVMRENIRRDAIDAGFVDNLVSLEDGGVGASAYVDAICVYLACIVDRVAYYGSTLVGWLPKDSALGPSMPRQAIAMSWDFVEANPLGKSSGGISTCINAVANYLDVATPNAIGKALQVDAQTGLSDKIGLVISTDPPYYDNVPYADLSDFFYVWLRRSLRTILPALFTTVATPKSEELVAFAHRHDSGKSGAETFFLDGMTEAMHGLASVAHPWFPITIYYAFKQSVDQGDDGVSSTGWDTFLSAVIAANLTITGTWPMRTEGATRMRGMGSNALASSIILVCRKRSEDAPIVTRREFLTSLKAELPMALINLQRGNIAPVDLAQAAIGPGMSVYSRYQSVIDADGKPLSVKAALVLINQTLDETLAEQEGDFDSDSRWALAWFDQFGFAEGEFGVALVLATAKNTSIDRLVSEKIVAAGKGRVRLLRPLELPNIESLASNKTLTSWEVVHLLVKDLEAGGEAAASRLISKLGINAESARELCYRLYALCERKKRAAEAMSYNSLVQSWPEIIRLAQQESSPSIDLKNDLFNQE